MAKLQSVAEQFRIAQQKTLAETHAIIVKTAKSQHARVMQAEPKPGGFRRFVDGANGAPEEKVKPNGVIVYQYTRLDIVAQLAMETLYDRSPVESGDYRNAHTLFLNGIAVSNLKDFKPGDEIVIMNLVPYARKIELGKMTMRVSGTDHVYAQAEQTVKRRYGNIARIRFTYRGVAHGRSVNQDLAASTRGFGKRAATGAFERTLKPNQHNVSNIRYPALIIEER